jgi:tungstate transport system ATP-binding protein
VTDAVGTPGTGEPGNGKPGAAEPGAAGPPPLAGPRDLAGPPQLVELRDAVVVRGARPVLTIDHLAIADGATLALVGPNGAGKSTLLLALASLIRLGRGALSFRGMPVGRGTELAYRRHIGLVLPDPLLLDTTVFANVAAGLRFRGVPSASVRPRVTEWLERLGVAHLRDRPARQISSGEAQRVSLARALVLEPDLLLLDEPFASVDAATRARLLDDLEGLLRETHVACVIVTHDLDEAVRLGDRMAVMVEGRIRQVDPPERVLAAPFDEDVAAFVGAETRLPGRVVSSEEGVAVVDVGGGQVEAVSALPPGRAVLCCLRPEDVTLWSVGSQAVPAKVVSSARNQLTGRVSRMVAQGSLVRVSIDCGATLVATITRASAADMGLAEGATILATFKASAVHLIPLAG